MRAFASLAVGILPRKMSSPRLMSESYLNPPSWSFNSTALKQDLKHRSIRGAQLKLK